MKKQILVLSGLLLILFASCQKEEIYPCSDNKNIEREFSTDDDNGSKTGGKNDIFGDKIIIDTLVVITDPNRDEDDEKREKRK